MALDLVGEDRILWGSDYPHIDGLADVSVRPEGWELLSKNADAVFDR